MLGFDCVSKSLLLTFSIVSFGRVLQTWQWDLGTYPLLVRSLLLVCLFCSAEFMTVLVELKFSGLHGPIRGSVRSAARQGQTCRPRAEDSARSLWCAGPIWLRACFC